MKKLTLTVPERVKLISSFIPSGKIIEMEIVVSLREKLRFSTTEIVEYELKDLSDGRISWNPFKIKEIDYEFEDIEFEVLKKGFEKILEVKEKEEKIDEIDIHLKRKLDGNG